MQFDEIYFPEILVRKLHGPVPRNPFPRESLGKKIAPNSFNKKYKLAPPERKLPMEIKISAATSCTNTHTHNDPGLEDCTSGAQSWASTTHPHQIQ